MKNAVILSEAKDLSQGCGRHERLCVAGTSLARFLASLGMTSQCARHDNPITI